jgi:ABC-type lipoprotein release transport system permease subunit
MAFRNLLRQKRRSLFTGAMMAGGFFLSSVFLSMADGTYDSIIELFTGDHTGHLQLHAAGYLDDPSLQNTLTGWPRIEEALRARPAVVAGAPRIKAAALAFTDRGTEGVRILAVDPEKEARTTRLKLKVKEGSYFPGRGRNEILAGRDLAKLLHLEVGSEVALVGQGADGSVANDLFTVTGLVGEKDGEGADRTLYLSLADAQAFLALPGRIHEAAVLLKDIGLARKEAAALQAALADPKVSVEPWQAVEKDFHRAMKADRTGDAVGQAVFLLLVALGVLNTVLMNLLERVPEYGLLKALGTRSSTLTRMIFLEMLLLALLSLVPGSLAAFAMNHYLMTVGIPLPTPFTYGGMTFTTMLGTVSPRVFLVPTALIVSMAVLVTLPAAWRIHRLTPVEALKRA